MLTISKKEETNKEDILYSLEPNLETINKYSYNVLDLSFGFPFGIALFSKNKNGVIKNAFLGFQKRQQKKINITLKNIEIKPIYEINNTLEIFVFFIKIKVQ